MTVPIATSPGRGGFGPQLALSYDSGAGNGPFGLGWNLSLPSITRKTDKGLPRYGGASDSGVSIISGAEDLVPVFRVHATGDFVRGSNCQPKAHEDDRSIPGVPNALRRYRPRIEGLFARIERGTNRAIGEVHRRSISKDNITTLYGRTAESRIADPADPSHVFTWLICQSYDDRGNVIEYRYKAEDSAGVEVAFACERNHTTQSRAASHYLKRILYGDATSLPTNNASFPPLGPDLTPTQWLFEVVFDYGEHDTNAPQPSDDPATNNSIFWPVRNDPFSSYRASFEARTYRLCQRVLMFHHIPQAPTGEPGYDGLVRTTDFDYSYEENPTDARNPINSFLLSVTQCGYCLQTGGGYLKKSLLPVEFTYPEAVIQNQVRAVDSASLETLPVGLDGSAYHCVHLDGEGLSGILTEQGDGWFYKRRLSPANLVGTKGAPNLEPRLAPLEFVAFKTGFALGGDGQPDLVSFADPVGVFNERTEEPGWEPFQVCRSFANLDTRRSARSGLLVHCERPCPMEGL